VLFLKGLAAEIAEKHSKLTIACQPKYDRLRCEDRGPLRGVLSDGLSMPPRAGAVILRAILKSEQ
jgi:hypothetical protein